MPLPTYHQITFAQARPGLDRPIAVLPCEPAQLEHSHGLRFIDTQDDLDEVRVALIETVSGRQYALTQHKHSPAAGVVIAASEHASDLLAELRAALSVFGVMLDELNWIHPEIESALKQIRSQNLNESIEAVFRGHYLPEAVTSGPKASGKEVAEDKLVGEKTEKTAGSLLKKAKTKA